MNKRPVYPLSFGLILLPLPQIHPSSLVLPQKKVATTTPNDGARCGVRTALPFGRTSRTARGSGRGELSGRRPSPGGDLTPALRAARPAGRAYMSLYFTHVATRPRIRRAARLRRKPKHRRSRQRQPATSGNRGGRTAKATAGVRRTLSQEMRERPRPARSRLPSSGQSTPIAAGFYERQTLGLPEWQ